MAKDSLFRKKSVDRVTSPDQMRDYLRVTSPKLWMLLGSIILLLAGFIAYAATAQMESTYALKMQLYDPEYLTGEIPYEQMDHITVGMPVRVSGETGSVRGVYASARLRLTATFASDVPLADGYYYLSLGESTEVDSSTFYYITCNSGIMTCSDMSLQQLVGNGDARARLWTDEWQDGELNLTGGRLLTISKVEVYTVATVEAALDNSQAELKEGIYDVEIVTESTTPISFLLN